MNSNIYFLFVWLETILFSSTEITDFSSQLSFFLANIKSEIWQLYVIWRHHCQSTRGSYLPLLIFSYKGISALYYSMITALVLGVGEGQVGLYPFLCMLRSASLQNLIHPPYLFAQSKPLEAYCPHNFLKIISPWYHVYNDMGRANL